MRSIQTSFILPGKEKLNKGLEKYLNSLSRDGSYKANDEFIMVNSISLCAISMVIFIRKKYVYLLSDIKNDCIGTGFGGVMANKGGVCISFKLGGKKLLFINCHQEAHQGNREKRNGQWHLCNEKFVHEH